LQKPPWIGSRLIVATRIGGAFYKSSDQLFAIYPLNRIVVIDRDPAEGCFCKTPDRIFAKGALIGTGPLPAPASPPTAATPPGGGSPSPSPTHPSFSSTRGRINRGRDPAWRRPAAAALTAIGVPCALAAALEQAGDPEPVAAGAPKQRLKRGPRRLSATTHQSTPLCRRWAPTLTGRVAVGISGRRLATCSTAVRVRAREAIPRESPPGTPVRQLPPQRRHLVSQPRRPSGASAPPFLPSLYTTSPPATSPCQPRSRPLPEHSNQLPTTQPP
jgi:hypothetical protein